MKVDVTNFDASSAGSVELSDDVFGLEPRSDLLQRVVRWQLAKRQQGTHKTKGRSEVSGTGAKMYRQKGTGRARHSTKKVPIFRGGGRAMGPQPRSHAHDLPKKVRALGLKHALSAKAKAGQLTVVDSLAGDGKTATLKGQFEGLGLNNALIIGGAELDQAFVRAARNLPRIDVLPSQGANVYDILRRDQLVLSKDAVEALEARLK